ncbi:ABC transporter permease [Paradevosia shaoguanensis]|uniref:ABC transporter permease n=1 Tax=Paradevosia shaoguanensis TaxID=1335043 RepID=A0AA41UC34_9HYPH|nr:ABC transporter permease [Paradevosia shaoguanensis]MCF1741381.1 ABC transporter permease [Paradevosia shaoguanensis]MCI0125864.1 ABC transporter permease [Paradevosia shaoguanensis]
MALVDTFGARARRQLLGSVPVAIGVVILGALIIVCALARWLAPYNPTRAVGGINEPPSLAHLFGTTGQGQDVLSQFLYGGQNTLWVAFAIAVLTTLIALVVALTSAYFRGWVDDTLTLVSNVFLVIPGLPLVVVLAAFLPPGSFTIIIVLTLTGWAFGARLFRSQALTLREREFIAAAEDVGESRWRIVAVELLPNMGSVVAAYFVNQVIFAITAQASLEFLGLGNGGQVTWGTMLFWAQNTSALIRGAWWTFVVPGMAIALTAFSLALINNAVDELGNPRLRADRLLRRAGFRKPSASLMTPVKRND